LQKDNIRHKNSNGTWDWTCCENPRKVILVIAGNETYWNHWKNYKPKSGKSSWDELTKEISDIIKALDKFLEIKFYATPNPAISFTAQANSQSNIDVKGYIPESLGGPWTEIKIKSDV
jgi:hypothetical protein